MSFPRYPEYKDSGVEWLGEVPASWGKTALKYLGDYQNGYPFKPDDRGEEGLPIIRIAQLTGITEPAFFSGNIDERHKVRNDDLLFSWSATIDSFIWQKGDAWLNQHIFKVTPTEEASRKFLFYIIKHVAPKLAEFDAHGSTMRHMKIGSIRISPWTSESIRSDVRSHAAWGASFGSAPSRATGVTFRSGFRQSG